MHWPQAACLLADIAAAPPSTEQHNTAMAAMDAKIPVLMILSPIKQTDWRRRDSIAVSLRIVPSNRGPA